MKLLGMSCVALVLAEDSVDRPANRSLLNSRRLTLTLAEWCHKQAYPNAFGKKTPFASHTTACDVSGKPALFVDSSDPGGKILDVTGDSTASPATAHSSAEIKALCCKAAPLCSTTYVDHGATAASGQAACGTAGNKVPASLSCYTTDGATAAKCSRGQTANGMAATMADDIDAAHCCRQMCNDATGGFETAAASATKPDCPTTGGTYQVSSTAFCAGQACAASDQATCCQKKCTDGVKLFGETLDSTKGNNVNCADGADRISPTAYCAGSTCGAGDLSTCCQNKCTDGYELFGGTTTGKRQCATGLRVSPDAYCSGPTCGSSDDKVCCETKCDKAGAGFELFGGKTTGMTACAKDLRVHPTEYCDGTDCKSSTGVCCQQKCTAGFKLKGATGTGTECADGLTVHATAYCTGSSCAASDAGTCCQQSCSKGWKLNGATTKEANTCPKDTTLADVKCKGSPCASTDEATCCNQKCTDAKAGFKVHKGSGKEPNECKKGETVSSKGMCKGDCSSDDAATCCQKANDSATTDAKSCGIAALVGLLVLIAASA